jgi:hypothetical protein
VIAAVMLVGATPGTQAPGELTKEYPLGEKLRQPTHSAADGRARPQRPSDEDGPPLWPFAAIPLAVAAALIALAVYARGGPPAAYGYAIDERPRHRRHVSPEVLHNLRWLLQYDRRRDAHVLKVVGHRIGPVLWVEPHRTGRFDREREGIPLSRDREAR